VILEFVGAFAAATGFVNLADFAVQWIRCGYDPSADDAVQHQVMHAATILRSALLTAVSVLWIAGVRP